MRSESRTSHRALRTPTRFRYGASVASPGSTDKRLIPEEICHLIPGSLAFSVTAVQWLALYVAHLPCLSDPDEHQ